MWMMMRVCSGQRCVDVVVMVLLAIVISVMVGAMRLLILVAVLSTVVRAAGTLVRFLHKYRLQDVNRLHDLLLLNDDRPSIFSLLLLVHDLVEVIVIIFLVVLCDHYDDFLAIFLGR